MPIQETLAQEGLKGSRFLNPKSNGGVSNLDRLFFSFEQVGAVRSIPIYRMRPPLGADDLDYDATRRFMVQVVAVGNESPEAGVELFVADNPAIKRFQSVATTGLAIEMLLNPSPNDADSEKWNERIMGTKAARSVVERKALVQSILTAYGLDLLQEDPESKLHLLSFGAGYGRCPLGVIDDLNRVASGCISGKFVDRDQTATSASVDIAEQRGLREYVETENADVFHLRNGQSGSAQLIEATGLTDYYRYSLIRRFFRMSRHLVSENGIVVVTNITSYEEKPYLDIVWGNMYRRTPVELADLATSQGFADQRTALVLDSTETMCTIVTRP